MLNKTRSLIRKFKNLIGLLIQLCLNFSTNNLTTKGIRLHKVVNISEYFCPNLQISITTELIKFSILGKLHKAPMIVLGYFVLSFQTLDGFKPSLKPLSDLLMLRE